MPRKAKKTEIGKQFPWVQVDRTAGAKAAQLAPVLQLPYQYVRGALVVFWEGINREHAQSALLLKQPRILFTEAEVSTRVELAFGQKVPLEYLLSLGIVARETSGLYRVCGGERQINVERQRLEQIASKMQISLEKVLQGLGAKPVEPQPPPGGPGVHRRSTPGGVKVGKQGGRNHRGSTSGPPSGPLAVHPGATELRVDLEAFTRADAFPAHSPDQSQPPPPQPLRLIRLVPALTSAVPGEEEGQELDELAENGGELAAGAQRLVELAEGDRREPLAPDPQVANRRHVAPAPPPADTGEDPDLEPAERPWSVEAFTRAWRACRKQNHIAAGSAPTPDDLTLLKALLVRRFPSELMGAIVYFHGPAPTGARWPKDGYPLGVFLRRVAENHLDPRRERRTLCRVCRLQGAAVVAETTAPGEVPICHEHQREWWARFVADYPEPPCTALPLRRWEHAELTDDEFERLRAQTWEQDQAATAAWNALRPADFARWLESQQTRKAAP